jgi:lipid II:glycine glycyltransferase (peptidoglycan interpeptide bridge formation enzyme)
MNLQPTIVKNIPSVNCIFQQPWWLDAVAPNQWSEVIVERDKEIIARLPYVIKIKYGLKILTGPPLTQTLGPWLKPSTAKYSKQLAEQKSLMNSLIEQLPQYDYFTAQFHYSIDNWLPFYWHGFSQTTYYTYVIEDLTNLDRVWNELAGQTRTQIRKAEKLLTVYSSSDIERFLDLNQLTFQRQGKSPHYNREFVRRLDAACTEHQARRIFFAEDAQGRIHAAEYLIWDENSAYYLMGGADPELRSSCATSLLMWEAIKFAATVTKKVDFEGSMIEPIESFFRGFGARQVPYFSVTGMSRRMKTLMAGRDMVKSIVRFPS